MPPDELFFLISSDAAAAKQLKLSLYFVDDSSGQVFAHNPQFVHLSLSIKGEIKPSSSSFISIALSGQILLHAVQPVQVLHSEILLIF